ncbi:hypothetical protein RHGRI_011496 [Rhododendron griersonianum]|uniref:Uncharacterized protein n=1 Tax=Rhododendron griersonianum TaxID=479676 RepID=A0AAV6KME9_9ERIC|nr:hypothetical protein RHGRI_011496 [Rhododendron griersonianum]
MHHRGCYLRVHRRANKSCITRSPKPKYLAYCCYHFNRAEAAEAVTKSEKIEMLSARA